jgi:pimeloyl-ACP methyl ester carboxylesterase
MPLETGTHASLIRPAPRRRALGVVVLAAALLYAAAGAALWVGQRHLIYEPERKLALQPAQLPFSVTELRIPVGQRQTLDAWWIPPRGPQGKLFLYFHGNGSNVASSVDETELLRELGHAVLMPDYRGFGASDGAFPSEHTMYEDAEATLAYAIGRLGYRPQDIYVYGHSLGAAVAVDLAARHPELGGLVAESAFTSIEDMARLEPRYAIFPVHALLSERFESAAKVERLRLPVLYIHGTDDAVVPFEMGRALYALSGGPKRFLAVEGGGHDDNRRVAPQEMRAALEELVSAAPRELAAVK